MTYWLWGGGHYILGNIAYYGGIGIFMAGSDSAAISLYSCLKARAI
jgi:hypothetical protein